MRADCTGFGDFETNGRPSSSGPAGIVRQESVETQESSESMLLTMVETAVSMSC